MRDGGAPWPPIEGGTAAIIEPARPLMTPEIRLCRAILEQALADLERARLRAPRRRDATGAAVVRWFRSADVGWPFAFESICATLGLDAEAVRDAVLRTGRTAPRTRLVLAGAERALA